MLLSSLRNLPRRSQRARSTAEMACKGKPAWDCIDAPLDRYTCETRGVHGGTNITRESVEICGYGRHAGLMKGIVFEVVQGRSGVSQAHASLRGAPCKKGLECFGESHIEKFGEEDTILTLGFRAKKTTNTCGSACFCQIPL